jgi:phospholipid/cholesterol/gamma-HCH transport system substrate-binding protein
VRRVASILASAALVAIAIALVRSGSSEGAKPVYDVTAVFDNAAFAVPGEDVRIAGANVGSIQSLNVCTGNKGPCPVGSPLNKAAVTIAINDPRFTPFYANARCSIRPQSLIGERYVDCLPGTSNAGTLPKITKGPGSGSYLLPVIRTSSPVDSDIVQDIYQQPIRERFALILQELGTGLAGRGSDLNEVIHRANPALGYTDQVIKILAKQNRELTQLSTDSDAVLTPLANARQQIQGFIRGANTTSTASAARANDIQQSFHLFPEFLRQLQPLLVDLGNLADQGTPLMQSLGQSATALGHQFQNLTPFAKAARPALIALGKSSQQSQPALIATEPLARQLLKLGQQGVPSATLLDQLLTSIDQTGGIEGLMSVLFNGTNAGNGFDALGHYARSEPLVGDCTAYTQRAVLGCSANFKKASGTASDAAPPSAAAAATSTFAGTGAQGQQGAQDARSSVDRVVWDAAHAAATPQQDALKGLLSYLMADGK